MLLFLNQIVYPIRIANESNHDFILPITDAKYLAVKGHGYSK